MDHAIAPIGGAAAWRGAELATRGFWPRRLTGAEIAALDAALAAVKQAGRAPPAIAREHFSIPALAPLLAEVTRELEDGAGVVRLSGLPVERLSREDLRTLFWGLCANIGTPLFQNTTGEVLAEVKDETGQGIAVTGGGPGPVPSARARSRSTGPLRFHTDKCDLLALLCASNGIAGGVSRVVSTIAIHDEMARRRPDLLAVLYEDFFRMRPADEEGDQHADRVFRMPVFSRGPDGAFTSQYSRTYVEMAHDQPEVPPLRAEQVEAMDMLAALADELCAEAPFTPGDIQLLNQHTTYHGRTAYADDAASGAHRVLLRIWLATPFSRALPEGHRVQWGAVEKGALRGGAILGRSAIAA
ncbi:TauD/TfdA family dioxygenase [Roseomonas sp. PWR1]|uniref:TauD/TfdA family dioxygenase n=1 Tax=Roseomonas nitratireducens TaxID=2820810 RepID=A0ABS4AT77_9PROT|nr:TauD/TfdA family dioxygenase [Neoroseomonas nitratireducens]MBP0464585.1 TauD/TfdA family dioxygenase [Neoroseomonas nitratireducens]